MPFTDLAGFGKFGEKLLDTLKSIGTGLFEPWQTRRVGRVQIDIKAEEIRLLAAAEKDAEDIRSGLKIIDEKGTVVPAPPPPALKSEALDISSDSGPHVSRFIQGAKTRALYRELKREINLRAIALLAQKEVISDEEVSDERVDEQWVTRWVDGAQDVSDEELRTLWAKLLAGEVKKPGSYSLQHNSLS